MLRVLAALAAGALASASACGSSGSGSRPSAIIASPTAVPSVQIVLPAVATLSAPSPDVVWALVADQDILLFRSTDRGATWQQRPLPALVGQNVEISFVSDTEGWLESAGSPETQCNAQSAAIWHTADAGATWQRLPARGIADAQCKQGFSFTDRMHGFIGSWSQLGRPTVYLTVDGGQTWQPSTALTDPPGFVSERAVNFLRAGRARSFGGVLLLPAFGYGQGESETKYVYRSTDGGLTWRYEASTPTSDGTLAIITATHWLQLILPGESLETTDSGRSWHSSPSDYSQAAPIAPEVDFADSQVGYATVRGEIQLTVDGGQHWIEINTPGT